jgi:hypothetical protein
VLSPIYRVLKILSPVKVQPKLSVGCLIAEVSKPHTDRHTHTW